MTPEYFQRQCDLFFPKEGDLTYGSAAGKTAETLNAYTEGWNLTNTTRLIWVNGEFDAWRSASVSSEFRPGGPLESTDKVPVFLLPGARHGTDIWLDNALANEGVASAQREMIAIMCKWVGEFYALKEEGTGHGAEESA